MNRCGVQIEFHIRSGQYIVDYLSQTIYERSTFVVIRVLCVRVLSTCIVQPFIMRNVFVSVLPHHSPTIISSRPSATIATKTTNSGVGGGGELINLVSNADRTRHNNVAAAVACHVYTNVRVCVCMYHYVNKNNVRKRASSDAG